MFASANDTSDCLMRSLEALQQYQKQINDLLQAVETLLNSNKVMGERVAHLERVAEAYENLKEKYAKLEGELAMRKRGQYTKD